MLFCIGLLTVESRLCTFVVFTSGLCAITAARAEHERYFELSYVLLAFVVSHICLTICLITPDFFGLSSLFSFIASMSSGWLAIYPQYLHGLHWRWIWGLVAMAAVMDLLVSTTQFCLPKSGLTYQYICLVCNHTADFCIPISRTDHVSPILGAVCRGTNRKVTNQVSQISHIFSTVRY